MKFEALIKTESAKVAIVVLIGVSIIRIFEAGYGFGRWMYHALH